jgi:hypothetical protein
VLARSEPRNKKSAEEAQQREDEGYQTTYKLTIIDTSISNHRKIRKYLKNSDLQGRL